MASRFSIERTFAGNLRHPFLFVLSVILAPVLWITFVATVNAHELIVGGATCLATLFFLYFLCHTSSEELVLRPRDIIQLWRIPWYIVSGVYGITLVAFKDLLHLDPAKSLYRVCGFETSAHDPIRKARTVLAVAYTTAAPNFIILGVDAAQSRMLFHQIESSSVPKMTKALGAKS
jgi:hypothetical protein